MKCGDKEAGNMNDNVKSFVHLMEESEESKMRIEGEDIDIGRNGEYCNNVTTFWILG